MQLAAFLPTAIFCEIESVYLKPRIFTTQERKMSVDTTKENAIMPPQPEPKKESVIVVAEVTMQTARAIADKGYDIAQEGLSLAARALNIAESGIRIAENMSASMFVLSRAQTLRTLSEAYRAGQLGPTALRSVELLAIILDQAAIPESLRAAAEKAKASK